MSPIFLFESKRIIIFPGFPPFPTLPELTYSSQRHIYPILHSRVAKTLNSWRLYPTWGLYGEMLPNSLHFPYVQNPRPWWDARRRKQKKIGGGCAAPVALHCTAMHQQHGDDKRSVKKRALGISCILTIACIVFCIVAKKNIA